MSFEVRLPKMAETMVEATVVRWLKSPGDAVTAGESIAELETDKAGVELEAPASGVLARILVPDGSDNVPVGELLAVIEEVNGRTTSPAEDPRPKTARADEAASGTDVERSTAREPDAIRVSTTPLGAAMAAIAGVDSTSPVIGGRITRASVEHALGLHSPSVKAPAARGREEAAAERLVPHSNVRKLTASRLTEAKQTIPHFYLSTDCEITRAVKLLRQLNENPNQPRLTLTSLIIRTAATAIRRVPAVNVEWTPSYVVIRQEINIAVGVQTAAGLVAPVIRNADQKSLLEIASALEDRVRRAKEGHLQADDLSSGSFTISNLGMFGIDSLFAIITPGQSCVLGTGACCTQPVVRDGELTVGQVMTVTLSADHRALDGADGARFLRTFQELIEEPALLIL